MASSLALTMYPTMRETRVRCAVAQTSEQRYLTKWLMSKSSAISSSELILIRGGVCKRTCHGMRKRSLRIWARTIDLGYWGRSSSDRRALSRGGLGMSREGMLEDRMDGLSSARDCCATGTLGGITLRYSTCGRVEGEY
jgi:hypothetical protein